MKYPRSQRLFLTAAAALAAAGITALSAAPEGQRSFADRFEVTSGDWSVEDGVARSDAPVFRARTETEEPADVTVALRFRIDGYEAVAEQHEWDGVHLGLRDTSPDDLYYLSVARRDGTDAIKRKSEGPSETLAQAPMELRAGRWHTATVSASDTAEGVRLVLEIDGTEVLSALDDEPLTGPGRVALRSDNVEVAFDDVQVHDA